MRNVFTALWRAMRSLMRLGVLWHLVWPTIVSVLFALLCVVAIFSYWNELVEALSGALMGFIQYMGWVSDRFATLSPGIVRFLVKLLLAFAFVLIFYVASTILVVQVALPMMLDRVVDRDYGDLEQRGSGSAKGSIVDVLATLLRVVLFLVVSLPLWLIPGAGVVVLVLAISWFTQRIYSYDVLMRHADCDELARLRKKFRPQLMLLGGGSVLLGWVPVVQVLAQGFSGLSFGHFLLDALRTERRERGDSIPDPEASRCRTVNPFMRSEK